MKKILIWILCFSLLIPYTAIFADEEQGNDSDIIFCDFETEQPFSKNESASYAKADDEHGMVLKLETNSSDNSQTVRYAEYRDLGITAEKVLCSFDFKLFQANNNFTFMLRNDAGGVICRMQFKNTGTIYVTNDGVNTKKTEIVPNEWCTAKILLDFNRKTIEASINNVYMNEITMAMVDSESISGAYMGVWQQGNDAKLYVDNVAFADYSDKGSLRDELNEETGIVFVSENIGNIYFDKSPTFTTRVYNDSQSNADFEITTRVVSESGRVVLQDTQVASIGAGSDHDIDYRVSVDYFGFYNVYLTAVNKVTGEEYSKTTVFSVVNTPKNGKVNPIMGVADHIINKKAGYNVMDKKVELMAKAGLSFYREEYNWTDYERKDGVYNHDVAHKALYEALGNYNMYPLVLAAHSNPAVTSEETPISTEATDRYGKYVANMSLDLRGITNEFEIYNEFNLKKGVTPEDYVKLCKAAYENTKKVNKDTVIYGLSGAAIPTTNLNDGREWVKKCFELGIAEYTDGFSIHPYEFHGNPETSPTFETVEYVKEIMRQYGVGDKPLISSEFGWPATNVSEENQAYYSVRYSAMAGDMLDKITWYNFQCKESDSASENSFGWIRQGGEDAAYPYEPYSAKPIYLAMANWNALMTGAKQKGRLTTTDKTDYIYIYKTEDGRDCLVAWNIGEEKQYRAYGLGAFSAEIYDFYGNCRNISAIDGAINVTLGNAPIYIIGKFSDFREETPIISIKNNRISSSADESETLLAGINCEQEISFMFELPSNISIYEEPTVQNKTMRTKLLFGVGENNSNEKIIMYVREKTSGNLIGAYEIETEYDYSASVELFPQYYRKGHWQIGVNVKNNKKSIPVSGTVEFDGVEGIVREGLIYDFSDLLPNTTKYLRINVPEFYNKAKASVFVKTRLDNGEEIETAENIYFCGFTKAGSAPIIDGILKPGEWDKSKPFRLFDDEQVKEIKDYKGVEDLSGNIYCMYDDDNFYLAAEITDDVFCDVQSEGKIYACDSIQFAFSKERAAAANRTEYSIGSLNGVPAVKRHSFMAVDTTIQGVKDGQSYDDIVVKITRDDEKKKTYYEASIPWQQIYGEEIKASSYKYMFFSVLVNDNDGSGRRGWMEYGSGIGLTKNPTLFIKVPVVTN